MSLSQSHLDALLGAGVTHEQIVALVRADMAERETQDAARLEAKRASNRDRQQRKRENDRNAKSRVTAVTPRDERDKGSNDRDILTSKAQVSEPSGSSPSPRPWALPVGVSFQVWQDFLGNRKRKRLGNSETAWKGFCDDLKRISSQTGIPPPKLIEHAAAKGWGSINDPQTTLNGQPNERSDRDPTTVALERLAAAHAGAG